MSYPSFPVHGHISDTGRPAILLVGVPEITFLLSKVMDIMYQYQLVFQILFNPVLLSISPHAGYLQCIFGLLPVEVLVTQIIVFLDFV